MSLAGIIITTLGSLFALSVILAFFYVGLVTYPRRVRRYYGR